ncbi:MAG: DNA-3-methyladenine glycosylase [Pseudomonadota bacterium]
MRNRITCKADIADALECLSAKDPRLIPIVEAVNHVPLRLRPGGFEGLCEIVVSQQVSKAAAEAIWGRFVERFDPITPDRILNANLNHLGEAGLSRPKQKTIISAAAAFADGFSVEAVEKMPSDTAVEALTALHGIGRWTAEVYLLFCAGHPDLFPARDVALQSAVAEGLGLEMRPNEKDLIEIAELWSPWRGTAARLWWAYYSTMRDGRSALPV